MGALGVLVEVEVPLAAEAVLGVSEAEVLAAEAPVGVGNILASFSGALDLCPPLFSKLVGSMLLQIN
jgi:hypothetical protein